MAAELLRRHVPAGGVWVILAGPPSDQRSQARVRGFLSRQPATVIAAPNWYVQGGLTVAAKVLARRPAGIFCCNDRLAEAICVLCAQRHMAPPCLVGFDDAPVAQRLGLTTIAIPWAGLVQAVVTAARRRLEHDSGGGMRHVLMPQPVIRWKRRVSMTAIRG